MIYSKLNPNVFKSLKNHRFLNNQRCFQDHNSVLFYSNSILNRLNVHILSSNQNDSKLINKHLRSDAIQNSLNYRFLFSKSHHENNLSKSQLPVIYQNVPKSLSTQSTTASNDDKDSIGFKKINREGNLNLVQTKTTFEVILPSAYIPYIELLRLNKFTGTMFLLYPCLWGISIGCEHGQIPDLNLIASFIIGAILMRSAGCIVNDLMDKNFDKQVERTKSRPLASGRLNNFEAIAALAACLTGSLHILLSFDCLTILYGASSLSLVTLYPLMKRFTNWPQLFLGFTFNWGAILGYSAIQHGVIDWQIVLPLYVSGIFWTLIYDTIYAYQDYHYDKKLGLKSTTMIFKDHPKIWLNSFAAAMTSSLLLTGYLSNQMYPFYMGTAFTAIHALYIIHKLNVHDPNNCARYFKLSQFLGYYVLMGIILSVLFKPKKKKDSIINVDVETLFDNSEIDDSKAVI